MQHRIHLRKAYNKQGEVYLSKKVSPVHGRFLNEYDSRPVSYSNAVAQPMLLVKSCRYFHPFICIRPVDIVRS